jgi:hypothetical protein
LREAVKAVKKVPFVTEEMEKQAKKDQEAELGRRIHATVTKTNNVGRPLPRYHPDRSTLPMYYEAERTSPSNNNPGGGLEREDESSGSEWSDGGYEDNNLLEWDEDEDDEDEDEDGSSKPVVVEEEEEDTGPPAELETLPVPLR